MEIYYTGVIIAVSTFLIIGIFHPIVMKTEYYTGTRYWWVFLVAGIKACIDGTRSWLVPPSSSMPCIHSSLVM